MSWVTVIWSMIASACLTLAVMYFVLWYKNPTSRAHLLFSFTAASTTAFAFCELWLMRAETPAQTLAAMRWGHVPLFFWLVSTIWFVWFYLGAGRQWLAWTVCGLRAFYLLLNFLVRENVNYRELTSLRHVPFLGEPVAVAEGVANPWMLLGHVTMVMLLVFVADAGVTAWRRGDRRKALMVGGGVEFFLLLGFIETVLIFWANVRMPIVFSPFYLGLVAVMGYELSRDVLRASQLVHELQASSAELRESEARTSLAVDAAELGIWSRDLARNEIWANDKWRELFGLGPSARLEYNALLQRLHPDDRDGLQRVQAMAIAGADRGRYQTEYRLRLPDGAIRWISSRGRVEYDAAGRPVLIRGASRDVTTRKHAEQERQRLRQEIAHAGRVSMMGELASALALEINQPLTAILIYAAAAERLLQHPSWDIDEVRAILAGIRNADRRAATIIDRMRGLLERHTVDARSLDVDSLMSDVAALVEVDALARQVKLEVEVPDDLPLVRGDRLQLQQVLIHLILNGMDALNEAMREDRRVSVTARLEDGRIVEVAVDDAGHGIPADALARIFDPFFTTKPNGLGMGLAISRTIVEAHGGRLWAENTSGGGAAFRFTLPIAGEADTE